MRINFIHGVLSVVFGICLFLVGPVSFRGFPIESSFGIVFIIFGGGIIFYEIYLKKGGTD